MTRILAGNWKMNLGLAESRALLQSVRAERGAAPPEHPVFASSRSLVAFERFQHLARSGEWPLPDVAARKGS